MQANKNAFYYVIDRLTGRVHLRRPFSQVTWAKGIDQKTGRPIVNEEAFYGTDAILISPGGGGAHNWSPMSFNPMTGLAYVPTSTNNSFSYAAERRSPAPGAMTGTVRRADAGASAAAVDWTSADRRPRRTRRARRLGSGRAADAMAHAGWRRDRRRHAGHRRQPGLSGVERRPSLAYSADKGVKLHEIQTGLRSGMGPPITYRLDGKQYIALMGGVGAVTLGNAGPGNNPTPFTPKLLRWALGGSL